jgi:hypothetical protein
MPSASPFQPKLRRPLKYRDEAAVHLGRKNTRYTLSRTHCRVPHTSLSLREDGSRRGKGRWRAGPRRATNSTKTESELLRLPVRRFRTSDILPAACSRGRRLAEVCFVIAGADGASHEVAGRADYRLSLSFLTFTHEMARVLIVEQVYRAFTIIKGYPYQK